MCRHVDSRPIDDPTMMSPMAVGRPVRGQLIRPGDYICYKQVSFWSITFTTAEVWIGSSFWTGTPVGTSSSIGQRVVVLDTAAEGGGGGGGGDITTSGSPARSQSNLQRILSGWSPPGHQRHFLFPICKWYFFGLKKSLKHINDTIHCLLKDLFDDSIYYDGTMSD